MNDPTRLVKELKGAPLSVFILLSLTTSPVTNEWLQANSGYTDRPVKLALMYLRDKGLAIKTTNGWVKGDGAEQLPLTYNEIEEEITESKSDTDCHIRNNSVLPSSSINNKAFKDSINTTTKPSRNNSDLDVPDEQKKVLLAFSDCGIRLNARTRKLLPHLSGQDVRDIYKELGWQGKQSETGILVVALEALVEKRQRFERDDLSRYKDWEH